MLTAVWCAAGVLEAPQEPAPSRSGRPLATVALRELVDLAAAGKTQEVRFASALAHIRILLIMQARFRPLEDRFSPP